MISNVGQAIVDTLKLFNTMCAKLMQDNSAALQARQVGFVMTVTVRMD